MPLAVSHMFGAWVFGKLFEIRRGLSAGLFGLLVFGGAFPDTDFLVELLFGIPFHRTFTHSLAGVLVFSGLVYAIVRFGWLKWLGLDHAKHAAIAFGCGMLIHIFLDVVTGVSGVQLLWPLAGRVSRSGWVTTFSTEFKTSSFAIMIDSAIGVLWLLYFWSKKQLRF